MGLEQRIYDSQDMLIGEPEVIPPGHHAVSTHRLIGHFRLRSDEPLDFGKWPDYFVEITAVCFEGKENGTIQFINPITRTQVDLPVDGEVVRFNTRSDDGTPGAVEWGFVSEEE